jgi:hypothetical protein
LKNGALSVTNDAFRTPDSGIGIETRPVSGLAGRGCLERRRW